MQERKGFTSFICGFFIEIEYTPHTQIDFILASTQQNQFYQCKVTSQVLSEYIPHLFQSFPKVYQYLQKHQNDRKRLNITSTATIILTLYQSQTDTKYQKGQIQLQSKLVDHDQSTDIQSMIAEKKQAILAETASSHIIEQGEQDNHDKKDDNQFIYLKNTVIDVYAREQQKVKLEPLPERKKTREEVICSRAAFLLKEGYDVQDLCKKLKILESTAIKMNQQFKRYGKIYPPRRPDDANCSGSNKLYQFHPQYRRQKELSHSSDSEGQGLSYITPNMKLPCQEVKKIKNILYELVKEGKMTSFDQMQEFLVQQQVWRSLSSIYRYVADIKADNPEFHNRNYTMHRKIGQGCPSNPTAKEMLSTYYTQ